MHWPLWGILLSASLAAGCWTDITYQPQAKGTTGPEEILPAESVFRDDLATEADSAPEPLPVPGDTEPTDFMQPTEQEQPAVDESRPPSLVDGEWFGEELATAAEREPQLPTEQPEPATPSAETLPSENENLLPWEISEEMARDPEPEPTIVDTLAEKPNSVNPQADKSLPLIPWDPSTESEPEEESTTTAREAMEEDVMLDADPVAQAVEASSEEMPIQALDRIAPETEIEMAVEDGVEAPVAKPSSIAVDPQNYRHLAWLLGSKMSYSLIAPVPDGNVVADELAPLAELLGVELPDSTGAANADESDRIHHLLAVGRELGDQVASSHGTEHAALVEVAFKSNLLLDIYPSKPHLIHAVSGPIAAAAVRAGLPEEVWRPWQDQVAAGESIEEIEQAVIELHTQIDEYLRQPVAPLFDATPPVLR
ncbi:MAG: hypothetical protein ACR2NU_05770 [Aeoliella sp.]